MISKEDFLIHETVSMNDLRPKVLSYREQEKLRNGWLMDRFETVLPRVMKRCGIDMWVMACKEYNEDPVFTTLVPMAMVTARRTTILVFHLQADGTVRRMALTRPNVGLDDFYESVWLNQKGSAWSANAPGQPETQLECLARIVRECRPNKIGLNYSDTFSFGDGISSTLRRQIEDCLDPEDREKVVSAEYICLGWLETRTEKEMAACTGLMELAHAMINEAFSSRVIQPGVTTNLDVKYFMMQRVTDMGMIPWFDFEVSVMHPGSGERVEEETTIMPGDVLHCDVGLKYLNLCTDTQENAYILRVGETDAPDCLKEAMRQVNRFQDIVISHFQEGRTGNEILALSRAQAIQEGLKPSLYTHPIGYHGHAAGPTIGLWDMQGGVPVQGDYPMYNDTCYSLELNVTVDLPQWGAPFAMCAETDVLFTGDKVYYLAGRQEKFHLVK